jgi:hypothetical protein
MERMMKVQEVILRAVAGKLKWWEAAEIIGVSDRTTRRSARSGRTAGQLHLGEAHFARSRLGGKTPPPRISSAATPPAAVARHAPAH